MQNIIKTAVIFAGGKSSRMGEDKALLPFGDAPTLTQYQYQRLSQVFETVYISAKSHKFDFDCEVIEDTYEEASPLVALLSIFETLEVESVFVLSVDSPFVDEKIIQKLMKYQTQDSHCIVARNPDGIQPLCAIYQQSILPFLKIQYAKNNHKLQDLFKSTKTHIINFDETKAFMNLNYQEDYQKALKEKI